MRRLVSLFVLSQAACSAPGGLATTLFENRADVGKLSLAVTLPSPLRDVADFVITVHREGETCSDPPLKTVSLLSQDDSAGPDAGPAPLSASDIVALVEGQYLVCAQPLMANGEPSEQCAPTEESLQVVAGTTIGVVLVSECEPLGVGGVEIEARVNTPPHVDNVTVTPSTRVDTCTIVSLDGTVQDPNDDPITSEWTVESGPPDADFTLTPDGANATITAATPGDYSLVLTASDPSGGSTSFTVPLTFEAASSDCASEVEPAAPPSSPEQADAGLGENDSSDDTADESTPSDDDSTDETDSDETAQAPVDTGPPLAFTPSLVSITTGNGHTCRTNDADGSVDCWGRSADGQSFPPTGVNAEFTSVDAAGFHTCGVNRLTHLAECWGRDNDGQSSPPTGEFDQVASGRLFSCGIRSEDQTVTCWGTDSNTRLVTPEEVAFSSITLGYDHGCGIRVADGFTQCWGRDLFDVLEPPSQVQYESISAGKDHTCGIRASDQGIDCWGRDILEQLGRPATGRFASVSAGKAFSCAIKLQDRTAVCWGDDTNGRLLAPEDTAFESLYSGDDHTCGVVVDSGLIQCWGFDADGQSTVPAGF